MEMLMRVCGRVSCHRENVRERGGENVHARVKEGSLCEIQRD